MTNDAPAVRDLLLRSLRDLDAHRGGEWDTQLRDLVADLRSAEAEDGEIADDVFATSVAIQQLLLEIATRPSEGRTRAAILDTVAWMLDEGDDPAPGTQQPHSLRLELEPGESWWGGAVADGQLMPFGARRHRRNLATSAGFVDDDTAGANQSTPLLVSSTGRFVWSDQPFTFAFDGQGGLALTGQDLTVERGGSSLSEAFRAASAAHFPATGQAPAEAMFSAPQYNTWIEMPYHPTQEGVLDYARQVVAAGFPPGLTMIDDRWSVDYGTWTFDPTRFPDPEQMNRELHALGFSVMVWLVPFLSPDSEVSRQAAGRGWLVRGPDDRPVVREWWNGYSTVLDLSHPEGLGWLRSALHDLQALGVDGFKFDAGDLRDYRADDLTVAGDGAVGQCEAWARLAAEFSFNELRACWKMSGQPLAQRLHDKPRAWGAGALGSLIPEAIAQGLTGHAFNCPDMIGGGELGSFGDGRPLDQELFVRFAQASALFPMMQFSLAPWRVLDAEHLAAVRAAVQTRQNLWPELSRLVEDAARTGEPILRPLAYAFDGYADVHDQFLVGPDLLCAPVLEPGVSSRTVLVPPGRWQAEDGSVLEGQTEVVVEVDLQSLPWWRRVRS